MTACAQKHVNRLKKLCSFWGEALRAAFPQFSTLPQRLRWNQKICPSIAAPQWSSAQRVCLSCKKGASWGYILHNVLQVFLPIDFFALHFALNFFFARHLPTRHVFFQRQNLQHHLSTQLISCTTHYTHRIFCTECPFTPWVPWARVSTPKVCRPNCVYAEFPCAPSKSFVVPANTFEIGTCCLCRSRDVTSQKWIGILDQGSYRAAYAHGTASHHYYSAKQCQKTRCSPRTRMQPRRTHLWNKLLEQSCAFSPCYRTNAM